VACILIYKRYAEIIVPIKCCAEAQKIPSVTGWESFAQVMTGYIFEEISQATHSMCIRELMKQV